MTFPTPKPGDVVTFTTRYRSYYYLRESDWDETTYENVRVLKPFRWMRSDQFAIPVPKEEQFSDIETGAVFDTRVISMKAIVDMNGKSPEQYEDSVREVEVPASKGGSYTVRVEDGVGVSCDCKGFQFRKQCRHLKEAEEL